MDLVEGKRDEARAASDLLALGIVRSDDAMVVDITPIVLASADVVSAAIDLAAQQGADRSELVFKLR